jgi:hypothetical protein
LLSGHDILNFLIGNVDNLSRVIITKVQWIINECLWET